MTAKKSKETLIVKAKELNLAQCEIDEFLQISCDYEGCKNPSILFLEGMHVCSTHGFTLIKGLTNKAEDAIVKSK